VVFFVVGLEIRREMFDGELATLERAALPLAAAVGGMLVPARSSPDSRSVGRGQAFGLVTRTSQYASAS
jgi:hypothetical protein